MVAGCGLLAWLLGRSFVRAGRQQAAMAGAAEQLAGRGFRLQRCVLGAKLDVLIAADDRKRIAVCEIGRDGTVLSVRIFAVAELTCEALEDGTPLDEARTLTAPRGSLVLVVRHRKKVFHVVVLDRMPRDADGERDLDGEYRRAREVVAWWRDTIAGLEPTGPYDPPAEVLLRVSSAELDAVLAKSLEPPIPPARVV